MRPKDEMDTKLQTGTFILSEKIDDTKAKKSEKEMKKEMKRLEKEKQEREKREKKAREKEKEREKQAKKGKVVCGACGGKCSGEVLRVTDKYFHTACFTCRACSASLARGGFFCKDGHYYCPQDYQRAFGTRCAACSQYVEGEVVSALGNTYHQKCFTCARCKRAFPSGEKVTYTGSEVICGGCAAPQRHTARATASPASPTTPASPGSPGSPASPASPRSPGSPISPDRDDVDQRQPDPNDCAGCGQELSEGQALVALDRQWHTWCFACGECGAVLRGEYMGRGGVPYCERDYQRLFGVRCAYCQRYISGKVLQAGDNHHFHPTCARCSKCGDPFGDGEEMFLQGAAIWHPRCGPAPNDPLALDRACSELQWSLRSRTPSVNGSYCSPYSSLTRKYGYRGVSPGLALRGDRSGASSPHRITTYSYLASEPATLRRCVQPYDRPPTSPHFHRPPYLSLGASAVFNRFGSCTHDVIKPLDSMRCAARRARVFLKEVKEREKLQQWKKQNLDPRNASRTPSAAREACWCCAERGVRSVRSERSVWYVSCMCRVLGAGEGGAGGGGGGRSSTLPPGARLAHLSQGDFTFSGLTAGDKTHSTDFSSGKSDISAGSITDVDRSAVSTEGGGGDGIAKDRTAGISNVGNVGNVSGVGGVGSVGGVGPPLACAALRLAAEVPPPSLTRS
ncbi:PREDICTED: uncharacterized protein LOC106116112 [Papilio xuthus]|uniref:Uncharacterized protein LOC106116112 n=1 Tax=Papilio xuthus TaxID=66420 RepID=A0AAJ6Z4M6_PAPXU|nr:PREDICTED: uncharacterized protein LOC106116112 [Papilio xuthus]